jgi:hypothetical protein
VSDDESAAEIYRRNAMKRHFRILLALLIAIAVTVGAFAIGISHRSQPRAQTRHSTALQAPPIQDAEHSSSVSPHAQAAALALTEMQHAAERHLGDYHPQEGSFGGTGDFSADWDIHWVVVVHGGHTVRIYHATEKQHPGNRFTRIWHEHESMPTGWEQVH